MSEAIASKNFPQRHDLEGFCRTPWPESETPQAQPRPEWPFPQPLPLPLPGWPVGGEDPDPFAGALMDRVDGTDGGEGDTGPHWLEEPARVEPTSTAGAPPLFNRGAAVFGMIAGGITLATGGLPAAAAGAAGLVGGALAWIGSLPPTPGPPVGDATGGVDPLGNQTGMP